MATLDECRSALLRLSGALSGADAAKRDQHVLERTVSCRVPDLGVMFSGRLDGEGIHDISTDPAPRAQIRLTIPSDELVAIADGQVGFASAWIHRRVKVDASLGDLLRLRKLF